EVLVPPDIEDEVLHAKPDAPGVGDLRSAFVARWLVVRPIDESTTVETFQPQLDLGESVAMALCLQMKPDSLLVDDRRARLRAKQLGLTVIGTLGLLRLGRDQGILPSVALLLNELRQNSFRISTALIEDI